MLTKHFKNAVYSLAAVAVFSANAGSYEDFFVAIRNDNTSNLNGLLERGFDPNTRDPKGQPGLTIAMIEHSPKAAKASWASVVGAISRCSKASGFRRYCSFIGGFSEILR